MIDVEVAYAIPELQVLVQLRLPIGSNVGQAVNASGLQQQFPEIDESSIAVGIFAKPCQLDQVLAQGDRVEIYRPLLNDPKDARRQRAVKTAVAKR
ncbi:MAG: RnfH family protein [Methylococcales bacterium]|nr:RnfH family protein [Methylococcaceae bacterium]